MDDAVCYLRHLMTCIDVGPLMKLLHKTHPADIAWVFRYLTSDERSHAFNIPALTIIMGEFLSEVVRNMTFCHYLH